METQIQISPEKIVLREDSRYIFQPRFVDDERTIVKAIVLFPDGSLREMEAERDDADSPLVRDVFLQYSEAEIEMHTHRERCMIQKMQAVEQRAREDQARREQLDKLFQAKSEALQMEGVKGCKDATITRRIRSAKTVTEVHSLAAYALMMGTEC